MSSDPLGSTTIGPDALVERVLRNYGLAADGPFDDLVERDDIRLLLAILLEHRGDESVDDAVVSGSKNDAGEVTPEYISRTVTAVADPEKIEPDFVAGTLVVRNFKSPVWVAVRDPEDDEARIRLDPEAGDEPFVLSPDDGFRFDEVWVGRPDGGSDATVELEVFE